MRLAHVTPWLAITLVVGCLPTGAQTADDAAEGVAMPTGTRVLENGKAITTAAFLERAASSAVICVGEQHDEASHHRVQHAVLDALVRRSAERDVELALGMEMFRRRMQPALNAFVAGEISGAELRSTTRWDKTWGFGFAMYEPMLDTAHDHSLPIIGLNAPRELTRAVARHGLASLPEDVRESLPELDLADAGHRKFFWAIMGFDKQGHGHGHGHGGAENFYTAQVIWDETMAESAAAWLDAKGVQRQIMVVAGNGHCHRTAIPKRAQRRAGKPAVSVLVRNAGDELPLHAESDFVIEVPAKDAR